MKLATKRFCKCGPGAKRPWLGAFTFAEVLAAMVFMAIVIPVAMQGLQIANRAGVVAQRKGVAVRLADRLLNEIIITGDWRTSGQRGSLGAPWKDFQWRVLNENWKENTIHQVTVEVTYIVQNDRYNVRLSTLVQDTNQ